MKGQWLLKGFVFFLFSYGVVLQRKSTDIEAKQTEHRIKAADWNPI